MIRYIAIAVIRLYQYIISPLLGPCCRFSPSCSTYTSVCIHRFGLARGFQLGFKRLLKCHPWGPNGFDPPPAKFILDHNKTKEDFVWTGKS